MTNENSNQAIPDFSHISRTQVQETFKWNIKDIYTNDSQFQKDLERLSELRKEIDKLSGNWTTSPENMFRLMSQVSEIDKLDDRTYSYVSLQSDADLGNSKWQGLKGELHNAAVNFSAKLAFIDPDIIALGRKKIDGYLASYAPLKVYAMDFDKTLRMEKYVLSTDKERIVAQTELFSNAPRKAAGFLNDLDTPSPMLTLQSGKRIRLNQANYIRYRESQVREDREKVMRKFWKNHAQFRNTHASLLNGAVSSHHFEATVRNYNSCLEQALYSHKIDLKVYHNLIETVESHLAPLHRYMKLKGRLLGLKKMSYDNIYASLVPEADKTFTIEEGKQMVIESLKPLGKEYQDILSKSLDSGWMDIYPNKGKRSGAYSNGSVYDVHPYVLMNYNGTFGHVSTLTHEFGHALHSWFSNRTQPYPLSDYPIFLAEVASTFNEALLVEYMLKTQDDTNFKLYVMDRYLEEFRGTMFRQTLFAHFELLMHQRVEEGKTLTADWLDEHYLSLTRKYYGHHEGITQVDQYLENEWSGIPHFYYNFYVYQYSTGIAASTALAQMVLQGGETERNKYLDFLRSGYSKYPLDTLKDAGVDLTSPAPIEMAIQAFDQTLDQMEAMLS